MRRFVLLLMMSLGASGAAAQADAKLAADLARVAQMRVFFGHQSVGENLLEGVQALAQEARSPLRVAEAKDAAGLAPGTLGHAFVGENRHPLKKLEDFERRLGAGPAPLDAALVKFCYLDIDGGTDAAALFARYQASLAALRARHPRTAFVHVTAPLTEVQGGVKGWVKRLLGRAPYGALENQRRAEYNALLRKAYAGREPVFDLARLESTAPGGAEVRGEWAGKPYPVLAAAWTDDGHHLNAAGRRHAARELLALLAALP
jgi:hypothetical protein